MSYKDEIMKYFKQYDAKKLTAKQLGSKLMAITKKIDKTEEKLNLTDCQLKNCYKQTQQLVMNSIDSLLQGVDKKKEPKRYELIMKYKKLFSKNITRKDIIKFDQDAYRMVPKMH